MEALFELIKLALLFVKILDQSSSSLLHLMQPTLKPLIDSSGRTFDLSSVLRVPHIVSDELLNGFLPLILETHLITHKLQLAHESVHILDQDIVSSDQNLLLLAVLVTLELWTLRRSLVRLLLG